MPQVAAESAHVWHLFVVREVTFVTIAAVAY